MSQVVKVAEWNRFEWTGAARGARVDPSSELRLYADVTGPGGAVETIEGFWDGGRTWRVRFAPSRPGEWTIRTRTEPSIPGLDGEAASFECIPYEGDNPLFRHGRVQARRGDHILKHSDGKPFFWLGDTAWNGPLKASLEDWRSYLDNRSGKGFNVVQFVTTQWLAAAGNADARRAYTGRAPIEIDPVFFQWMDQRMDAINDAGFLGAGVIAWAAIWSEPGLELSPGTSLPDAEIVRLARYMLARYGAHHMCWILAGDGQYEGAEAARWARIGREAFAGLDALATIHPGGHLWVEEEFQPEPWFGLSGYQSGHWKTPESARWITSGPAHKSWKQGPAIPRINLEFCYEGHEDFDAHQRFNDYDIRRDAYGSLLSTAPAGVTYGCHGLWSWESKENPPMSHPKTGVAPPWFHAIHFPGSFSMKYLREIFEAIDWWRLRPCPELLHHQPGDLDAFAYVSAARSDLGDLAIFYVPKSTPVTVRSGLLRAGLAIEIIEPASGLRRSAGFLSDTATTTIHPDTGADAVILLRSERATLTA